MNKHLKRLAIGLSAILVATPLFGAPVLRQNIVVVDSVVTVGDMFENAGALAETGLFRAPAPGTAGQVSVENIRLAIAKAGFTEFENPGFANVSVARSGVMVDAEALNSLIVADLTERGLLAGGTNVNAMFDEQPGELFAARTDNPIVLQSLRYIPASNRFTARFLIAGQSRYTDYSGRLDFSISAPHLTRSLPAGTILQTSDFVMRNIALQSAQGQNAPELDQLVGRQLLRQLREGTPVRFNDVAEPVLIARNDIVTIYLRTGALTLTVKGQALDDASRGQVVSVLNLLSNRVVQGIAINPGTVEIQSNSNRLASL